MGSLRLRFAFCATAALLGVGRGEPDVWSTHWPSGAVKAAAALSPSEAQGIRLPGLYAYVHTETNTDRACKCFTPGQHNAQVKSVSTSKQAQYLPSIKQAA